MPHRPSEGNRNFIRCLELHKGPMEMLHNLIKLLELLEGDKEDDVPWAKSQPCRDKALIESQGSLSLNSLQEKTSIHYWYIV